MSRLYPCEPWPIDPVCCPGWPRDQADWQPRHHRAQMLATIQLWRAVAGVIGLCRVTELPCLDRCETSNNSQWMRPYRGVGGGFYNDLCGKCTDSCSCRRMCTVTLQGPVHQIDQVCVDGEVVPADQYQLLTGDRLANCEGCWPACQDYCAEDGLVVTHLRGIPPGPDAVAAVSMLACRRLAECPPDGDDCGDLPDRTTSIQREGLSMQLSGGSVDEDGLHVTGIGAVDAWIASINPYGISAPASVWSPDVPTPQVWRTGSVR